MEEKTAERKYTYKQDFEDFKYLLANISDEFFFSCTEESDIDYRGIIKKNGIITIKDTEISGEVRIENVSNDNFSEFICENVKITNCIISKSKLSNNKEGKGTILFFHNCEIEGIYINENSSIGDLFIEKDCRIGSIEISNSTLEKFQIDYSILENLLFIDNSEVDDFICIKVILNKLKINSSSNKVVRFHYCSTKTFEIKKTDCKNLDLFSNVFEIVHLDNSSFDRFDISCCISKTFFLYHLTAKILGLNSIVGSISSFAPNVSQLILSSSNIPHLRIYQSKEIEVFISDTSIGSLDLRNQFLNDKTKMSFSNTSFFCIEMKYLSILGNLYFRKITSQKTPFNFDSFENLSIHFNATEKYKLDPIFKERLFERWKYQYDIIREKTIKDGKELLKHDEPTISISQSSLGKTEFTDCPLDDFRFEFSNSKIIDCFVSGGSIPTNNVHIIGAKENSIEEHEQKASFFIQFKKIFEAQGDIYHATQFQAKWAEEQRKELQLRHKQEYARGQKPVLWSRIKIFFNTTSNDRFTLWLNKKSNIHGESYLRALVFIFISALVFYFFYLLSIQRLFSGNPIDWNLFGYLFEFINPAHKLNFIEGNKTETINGFTVVADFVGRVFVSYGIYQFIAAFRKHTKKQ